MNDNDAQFRVRRASLDRRAFLTRAAGLGGAALASSVGDRLLAAEDEAPPSVGHAADASKAPFKVLYSNDTTHIISCVSPYHRKGEPFRREMLEASVDETAGSGVDAHLLQPGLGVVPWWKSGQYPYDAHVRWFEKTYGVRVRDNLYAQYMLDGGDMVDAFVRRCREKGLAPFVSLRMNDLHGKELVDNLPGAEAIANIPGFTLHCLGRFYKEHPEYRLDPLVNRRPYRGLDWTHAEVREWVFGFARELCRYDIDGFEMDFMRSPPHFREDKTTHDQRVGIMAGFVRRVRQVLDRTSTSGRRRWLCVRVPAYLREHSAMGVDLPRWVDAGLDMVNLSYSYFTRQDGDLAAIRKRIPRTALYLEMCHTTRTGKALSEKAHDNRTYRRTTDLQYYTTAHLAYARGLDGVSFFNFPYYREHGDPGRAPFHEPPFHVMRHIGDPDWLARQPQHYFLGSGWYPQERRLPRTFQAGRPLSFDLDMAPPSGGWRRGGKLRIQADDDLGASRWTARLNGRQLEETGDRSEPYDQAYSGLIGVSEQYRAWTIPAGLPVDGTNTVQIELVEGGKAIIVFFDLAVA